MKWIKTCLHFKTDQCLHNLIKEPTCFKSIQNQSCIDHIYVTDKRRFINSETVETGLSDWHKMIVTTLNTSIPKKEPRIMQYRNYKNFNLSLS